MNSLSKHLSLVAVLMALLAPTLAYAADGVITCDGYAMWGEPVRAGETVVFTKDVSWHKIRQSDATLHINPKTGKVTGRIEISFTQFLFIHEQETQKDGSVVYELDGTIHRDALTQAQITGRNLIRGNLTTVRNEGVDLPPDKQIKNTFTGLVSRNSGRHIPKLPAFGDNYIIIFPFGYGPAGGPDADHARWLDTFAKKNFNNTFGIAAVKFEVDSDMPAWFLEASAEALEPRALVDGTFDASTFYPRLIEAADNKAHHVVGAATDGVTRVWTLMQCPGEGTMQFSLANNGDGGFCLPQSIDAVKPTITVDTFQGPTTTAHYACVLYAPPPTFTADGTISPKHHRDIEIKLKWQPKKPQAGVQPVTQTETFALVRPPVVLQHGTFDNQNYCWRQYPQDDLTAKDYPPGHNAMFNVLQQAGYVLPNGKPAVFTVNFENEFVNVSQKGKYTSSGLSRFERTVEVNDKQVGSSSFVNLAHVTWENPGGIRNALQAYRDAGIAATQADVITHSLGGLVARLYIRGAHLFDRSPQQPHEFPDSDKPIDKTVWYYRPDNFMKGDVHRLITIATTHKGSDAPGMLIPYQLLSDGYTLDDIGNDPDSWSARLWRAVDFLVPGSIGPVDRKTVKLLLHFIDYETGMGGAFHDQQPNSAALNAIGATPVPAHAIACISRDADLSTFKSFYWQRMTKIYALSPESVIRTVLEKRDHGTQSFNALHDITQREDKARQIIEQAMYSGNVYRSSDIPAVDTLAPVKMFRSVIFGNQPNDCTVRLESALGGLTTNVDASVIDNVLHGYASTYPAVQKRVLQLLRGGFSQFNTQGFPPAGGPTRDLPPPGVAPPPQQPKVSMTASNITGTATRADLEKQRIETMDTLKHLASNHIIACNSGQVDLQFGFDELNDAMVQAKINAHNKPALVMIGGGSLDHKRLEARIVEGSMRIDKHQNVSCLMRTYTPSAVIENLNTSYTVTHNYETQTTTIEVHDGAVRVHPLDGSPAYELKTQQKASLKKPATLITPQLKDTPPPGGRNNSGIDADSTDETTTDNPRPDTNNTSEDTSGGTSGGGGDRPMMDPPDGPMDREVVVMGDGSVVDATKGTTTPPPAGGNKSPTHVLNIPRDRLPPSVRNRLPQDSDVVKVRVDPDGDTKPTTTTTTARPPIAKRPDGPFDKEVIDMGDGTKVDVHAGQRVIDPPKGPFDREIIQAPRDQPWAEQPGQGPVRNLRDLVFHQIITNDADRFDKNTNHYNSPMLSASGNRIVFAGKDVWVVDYNGNNLRKVGQVPSSVATNMDISPDGQWVTYADNTHLFAARADGTATRQLLESTSGTFYGLRVRNETPTVYLMCIKPGKARLNDDAPWQDFGNGIWAIDPSTAARRHIVDFAAMAQSAGYANYTFLSSGYNGSWVFDVSDNGKRIVFALKDNTLKTTRIFAVENGVKEIARVKDAKYNATQSLAISGDGSTIAYVTSGENGAVFVVNFDGSNHRPLLNASDTTIPITFRSCRTQLSHDGTWWLNSTENMLIRVRDGLCRSIGHKWDSNLANLYQGNHYQLTMNRDATRFMFRRAQEDGRITIVTMTPNPPDPGNAPTIRDVKLTPPRLHATEPSTLTARVDTNLKITHARMDVFAAGLVNQDMYYKDLRDDGKYGDETANDGIYTTANIKPRSDRKNWTGNRVIRITLEGLDPQGMRHGTSVDYGPWPTVE